MKAMPKRSILPTLPLMFLVMGILPARAEPLSFCPSPPESFWPELRSLPPGVVEIESDFVETVGAERTRARGNVSLFADGRRLDAESIDFEASSQTVETLGSTRLFDGDLLVRAERVHYRIEADKGLFSDVQYWLRSRSARGSADEAAQEGAGRVRLTDGTYTTCPEGNDSWWLSAGRVRLDQDSGRGHANNVTLRFKDVPIFYTPYINFPIDDRRQSGLLTPTGGYSSRSGLDLALPWYWNIAPNYDATLTPRVMSQRGVMLDTEWRYLRPGVQGSVEAAILPNDREADDDRYLIRWQQQASLTPNLALGIDATEVSDQSYFRDFGDSVYSSSTPAVERRAELVYGQPGWRLTGRVQDFESLDPTTVPDDLPYRRLPQVLLQAGQSLSSGLFWDLRSELVQFERKDSVTGTRFDFRPEIGYRHEGSGYFIEPRLALRHTRYELEDTSPGAPDSISRTLPTLSVDGGLVFDRTLSDGNLQTLEPRVFYGYVPFRDQDDIPRFDTGEREFSFDSLFTTQRFIGADRVGDTHQITTALTSRIIDPSTGMEQLSVSAGQITYLDDRRVQLRPTDPPRRENRSELAAEAQFRFLNDWQARTSVLVDTDRDRARLATLGISYNPQRRVLLNLGYRLREDEIEQTDISGFWPLSDRLQAIGRWNYSLRDDRDIELLAGLEYRTCCYGLRVALRRSLSDFDGEYNNSIYFQLTLDGLTRLDTGLDNLLREGISGYDRYDDHR